MSHISLQMYTLRDWLQTPDQVEATLEKVAQIGYRYAQISVPAFMSARDFALSLRRHGLKADSFSCLKPDLRAELDALQENAALFETNAVRAGAISVRDALTREGFLRYAGGINAQAQALQRVGLRYIYHFHAYEFVDFGGETGMDILLREAPLVEFQPDVHWLAAAGYEPSRALGLFRGRAKYIHMQGYAMLPGADGTIKSATVPVGAGNLNWEGIVNAARSIGIGMFVVEQDDCQIDAFESVRQSFDALIKLGVTA